MIADSPVLSNILSLAEPATWHHSLEMAGEGAADWLSRMRMRVGSQRDVLRVVFVGCGTSYYAGKVAKFVVEQIAHIPAEAMQAFEFATYAEPAALGPQSLIVGISTTGESDAVRDALSLASHRGAQTLAITANADSSVGRAASAVILTGGEKDRTLVKTMSYVLSLVVIYVLAASWAQARGIGGSDVVAYWRGQVERAALGMQRFLERQLPEIQQLVEAYSGAAMVFLLGSGPNTGTVAEAALKVIEMAKLYSEATELEDFLHGRFREVDQDNPMFLVAPQGRASGRFLDFLTITQHIGAPTIVLTDQITPGIRRLATHTIQMPVELDELATPLVYITPLHLYAHGLALRRGWDPLSRRYEDIVPQKVRYQGEPA